MEKTFEEKAQIVASAFYNRNDEDSDTELLNRIFDVHDLSGAVALAYVSGDIEFKNDVAKGWIDETYNVLNSIFDFPDKLELVEIDEQPKPKAKKTTAKKKEAE